MALRMKLLFKNKDPDLATMTLSAEEHVELLKHLGHSPDADEVASLAGIPVLVVGSIN